MFIASSVQAGNLQNGKSPFVTLQEHETHTQNACGRFVFFFLVKIDCGNLTW